MKKYNIAVAGTGYVGLSIAVLEKELAATRGRYNLVDATEKIIYECYDTLS